MKSFRIQSEFFLFLVIFSSFFMINANLLNPISFADPKIEPTGENPIEASVSTWIDPILISVESDEDAMYPDIAIDGVGSVHIVWQDNSENYDSDYEDDILYRMWNASLGTFTSTTLISSLSTGAARDPAIAVDNAGNVHVVWMDVTNVFGSGSNWDIFYRMWNKSTNTWWGHSATYDVVTSGESAACEYPAIAVDFKGNVHVVWTDYNSMNESDGYADIYYKCWNATRRVWGSLRLVSSESTSYAQYPSIATDTKGNVHVAWEDYTNLDGDSYYDIFYKNWNATTGSWTVTKVISSQSTYSAYKPSIAVDGLGNVHITWYDSTNIYGSGTDNDIFYRMWNITTGVWRGHVNTTDVVSGGSAYDSIYPQVDADALGNVFVVWEEYRFGGGYYYCYSIVQRVWNATSHSWGVNESVFKATYDDAYSPSIAVDIAGNSHVTWYQEDGSYYNIFYRRSIVTVPMVPILQPITPNPNPNLDNQLIWSNRMDATWYYVYKNTSFIASTAGLTPIAKVSETSYADVVTGNGTYYYAIVAENMYGNSSISNCQGVTVAAVSGFFRLRIAQNADFAKYGFAGDGTESTPWLIEKWFINGYGGNGIYISDTTDHFVLRNNTIFNGNNGIYLNNVTNGQLINNTVKFNKIGFNLTNSKGNFLYNNTAYNNTDSLNAAGFSLYGSDNNWLSGNVAFNNKDTAGLGGTGVLLQYSDLNKLRENKIHHNFGPGIFIENSLSNNITRNEIYSNKGTIGYSNIGLGMEYGSSSNVIEANNIYDHQVGLYFQHPGSNVLIKNNTLHNNNRAIDMVVSSATGWMFSYNKFFNNNQAGDLWCGGATFYKNEVWNNTNGLYFWGSGGSILINNTAWNNINYGFLTQSAESMQFYNNTAIRNGIGFEIGWADDIIMKKNFAINNTNYGFYSNGALSQFTENFVSGSNYGVYLSGTETITLKSNTIINNNRGVYVLNAKYTTIDSNIIRKNSQYGLYCESSNHTMITWNTICNSTRGVYLLKNLNSTVRYNEISNNSNYGIYVENVNNSLITWNELLDNGNWISYKSGVNVTIEKNACFRGPILNNILPNPAYDGWVRLNWMIPGWVPTYYLIYRKFNAPITSFWNLVTMTPILNVTPNQAIDSAVPALGIYYYVIVAGNASCWSTISNNQWVNVTAYPRPATPVLSAILPNVSYTGQIKLDWNDAQNATRYYVYKHTSTINAGNIGSLSPIAKVTLSAYTDNAFINGTFYYAVIAGNTGFNSSVSNCQSVLVQRQPIPGIPVLSQITPRPDYDGAIQLDWPDTVSTTRYYVYRDSSPIISVSPSRIPHAVVFQSNYTDAVLVNITYYYAIVAGNSGFNGSLSNCRNITVILYSLPGTPILGSILPTLDYDGVIQLSWTNTVNTVQYYIYRELSPIGSVTSLTPKVVTTQITYTDVILTNGTFYYAIVAGNPSRNSTPSNNGVVEVKLYSVPLTPILNPIIPSIDYDGIIHINWTITASTNRYYIYRNISFISEIGTLRPIAMVTTNKYTDILSINNTYYYAIVSGNPAHNSTSCSNSQSVIVAIIPPPGTPFLEPILPSYNGTIWLNWNDTINTVLYYIYRDTSFISSVGSRTPYVVVTLSNYTDFSGVNGTLFYAIVSGNFGHNSSISNCRSVTISIYPPPTAPILNPIVPAINTYGIISLNWTDSINTAKYYVYKSNSFISMGNLPSLNPIVVVTQSEYTYLEIEDGLYYYAIVSTNPSWNSSCSNCQNVTVNLYNPPGTPHLDLISPNPDYDGTIRLEWDDAINATTYYVYQNTSKITSINLLTPRAVVSQSFYTDVLSVNITYYYVIVAGNNKFNSSLSNCQNVTVTLFPVPSTPILNLIVPAVDYDGIIKLNWSDTASTIRYYVYKDVVTIVNPSLLVPLAVVTQSNYTDISSINGTFYYLIMAGNLGFNSSISECRSVKIEIYPLPTAPILLQITPTANYDGIIQLNWSDTANTIRYYVYRDKNIITPLTINSLTPIEMITPSELTNIIYSNGTFYYCIVAGNPSHNSSLSNCRSVSVMLYSVPGTPTLDPLPSISYNGIVHLDWSDTTSTTKYYVFRDLFFISNPNLLKPIAIVSQSEYTDVLGANGTYYYAVLAGNPSENSTLSSCLSIIVQLTNPPTPPQDYTWLIIVIVIGACAAAATLVVVKVRSKPQRAQMASQQLVDTKPKLKGVKSEWKESLAIEDKIRALKRNLISIEELAELSDAELSGYFNQAFTPIPIKLIEFLQRLDAPLEDKMEIIAEFNNLSEEQKQEYLKELTEL